MNKARSSLISGLSNSWLNQELSQLRLTTAPMANHDRNHFAPGPGDKL